MRKRVVPWAAAAFATQALDVWTTKCCIGLGARELNPLMRPLVERGRYGALTTLKFAVTAGCGVLVALTAPKAQRGERVAAFYRRATFFGVAVVAWNTSAIFRRARHEGVPPLLALTG